MNRLRTTASMRLMAAAALSATVGLTACTTSTSGTAGGGEESEHTEGRVALLLPDMVTVRWEAQDKPVFLEAAEKACPECEVTVYNAKGSADTQLAQAQAATTNGVDVVVIAPIDKNAAVNIANQVKQAGATVISYASIIDSPSVDYGVTTDVAGIGAQQAQSLVDGLAAKGITSGGLIVHNGDPSDAFGWQYKKGVHSVLDKTDFDIVAEYDTKAWDGSTAQAQMDQAITKVGKDGFVGVYAANDQLAGGVIAAMKNAGIDPSTRLTTGQDGAVAGLQRILAGEQYNTINLPIKVFAARTAELATALATGEEPPAGIINGTTTTDSGHEVDAYLWENEVITIDNIDNMIVPKGFWPLDEVCTPQYEAACKQAGLM